MFNIINQNVEFPVYSVEGKEIRKQPVEASLFGAEPHMPSVQLAVRVELANCRRATAKTKTRAEVSGGGKKPWRQKGTGRARAGSTRSPIFRHGGTVFGPTGNENHSLKINKKVYLMAFVSALSAKAMNNEIVVLDVGEGKEVADLSVKSTKKAAELLKNMGINKGEKTLVVVDSFLENLILSMRNIENLRLAISTEMSIHDILNAKRVILTSAALDNLIQTYCYSEDEEEKEAK